MSRSWKNLLVTTLIGVTLFFIFGDAHAQDNRPLPIVKKGSCPLGYRKEGNYCIPRSTNTPLVIEKKGKCPPGFRKDVRGQEYCVKRLGS